jgi:hypothetical protein
LLGSGNFGWGFESLCAIRLTIEKSADTFKHLFERVEDLSLLRAKANGSVRPP